MQLQADDGYVIGSALGATSGTKLRIDARWMADAVLDVLDR
jgi:hypothetical protein